MQKKYLHSLDIIKGSLIILVMLGHMLQGSAYQNIARYIIYGFHMPLFVAVSGFLVNYDKLKATKPVQLINNYLFRVIIPWCLAVIVYYIITTKNGFHLKGLMMEFIAPFYHLWYIPALLFFIFITWLLSKISTPFKLVLALALLLSVVGYLQFLSTEIAPGTHLTKLGFVFKVFRPQFYLFFCIGIAVRMYAGVLKFSRMALVAGVLIGFGFYISCFFNPNLYISTISFFVLNICLAVLILQIAEANKLKRVKSLEWLGVNSLPVYLWHVVPLLIVQATITYKNNEPVFYLASIVGLCIVIIIIKLLTKVPLVNKYVFGSRV